MKKSEAYKIVFEDLKNLPMFMGKYDIVNGNENFMYGISTVMDMIVSNISEEEHDKYINRFNYNMLKSKEGYFIGDK